MMTIVAMILSALFRVRIEGLFLFMLGDVLIAYFACKAIVLIFS